LSDDFGIDSLTSILSQLSVSNDDSSRTITSELADCIDLGSAGVVLHALLNLDDGLAEMRCELAMSSMLAAAEADEVCIGALTAFARQCSLARDWLAKRSNEPWVGAWLLSSSKRRRNLTVELVLAINMDAELLLQLATTAVTKASTAGSFLRCVRSMSDALRARHVGPILAVCTKILKHPRALEEGVERDVQSCEESHCEAFQLLLELIRSDQLFGEVVALITEDSEIWKSILDYPYLLPRKYVVTCALVQHNKSLALLLVNSCIVREAFRITMSLSNPPISPQARHSEGAQPPGKNTQLRQAAQCLLTAVSEISQELRLEHQKKLLEVERLSMSAFMYLLNGLLRQSSDAIAFRDMGGMDVLVKKYLTRCLESPMLLSDQGFIYDSNASSTVILRTVNLLKKTGETKVLRDETLSGVAVKAAILCLSSTRLVLPLSYRGPFQSLIVSLVSAHYGAAEEAMKILTDYTAGAASSGKDGSDSPSSNFERLDLTSSMHLPSYLIADANAVLFACDMLEAAGTTLSTAVAKRNVVKLLTSLLIATATMPPADAARAQSVAACALCRSLTADGGSISDSIHANLVKWSGIGLKRAKLLFKHADDSTTSILRMTVALCKDKGSEGLYVLRWKELCLEIVKLAERIIEKAKYDENEYQLKDLDNDASIVPDDRDEEMLRGHIRALMCALNALADGGISGDRRLAEAAVHAAASVDENIATDSLLQAMRQVPDETPMEQ